MTAPTPALVGVHHVTIPVSDAAASRDWYATVLDFVPVLDQEDENALIAVTLEHPAGIVLRLRTSRERAQALVGFIPLSLAVASRTGLDRWRTYLTDLNTTLTPIHETHLGWAFTVIDPDGIHIELHTLEQVSAEAD